MERFLQTAHRPFKPPDKLLNVQDGSQSGLLDCSEMSHLSSTGCYSVGV